MSTTKSNKKVTKKVKAPKKSPEQLQMEKFQKQQAAFTEKMKKLNTDMEAVSKKYGVKILAQGYDVKNQAEFRIGSGIKNHLEGVAMSNMAKATFA